MKRLLLVGVLVLAGCGSDKTADFIAQTTTTSVAATVPTTTVAPTSTAPVTTVHATTVPAAPTTTVAALTAGQKNAVGSAKSYVKLAGFSRQGLINQLLFEKYSVEDATYGADNAGADWNAEAAEAAISYLKISSFSRQRLIDQLVFAKFTPEEAAYGATAAGL